MASKWETAKAEYYEKYGVEYPKWPTKYSDLDDVIDDRFRCEPTDSEILRTMTEWELHTEGEDKEIIQAVRNRIEGYNEEISKLFSADDELERLQEENANLRLELIQAQEKYARKDADIKRELVRAYRKIEDLQRDLELMEDEIFGVRNPDGEPPEIVKYNYRFRLVEPKEKKATA